MPLRLSRFVHLLPVGEDRILILHAVSHLRLVVDRELAGMLQLFAEPQATPEGAFAALVERGVLTPLSPDEELAAVSGDLAAHHGRDPAELVDRLRREAKEGGESYWAAGPALGMRDIEGGRPRLDVLLLGDCDVQMEADFLRREAGRRGLDLRVAASFPDDLRFAEEHRHDAILIGALRARHLITDDIAPGRTEPPYAMFLAQAQAIIEGLRAVTPAPILIDELPEPTVQPLGMADRGGLGHRNRFRLANIALAELVEAYADVHVAEVAAILAGAGAERLLDDGQVGFTHFGSPGWMLQRPDPKKLLCTAYFPTPPP